MDSSYRRRLSVEGLTLAGSGALGSVVLLATAAQAQRMPLSTAGQLAVVAGLLVWFGPRGVRRALAASRPLAATDPPSGRPTPLWQAPLGVLVLAGLTGLVGGWDAGLRVTLGCMLVGAAQSVLLERLVAVDERATRRVYRRVSGSSWLRGTRLAYDGAVLEGMRAK